MSQSHIFFSVGEFRIGIELIYCVCGLLTYDLDLNINGYYYIYKIQKQRQLQDIKGLENVFKVNTAIFI